MTTPTNKTLPDFAAIQLASYHKRMEKGQTCKECIRCGKQTNESHWIEIEDGTGESQGCFPLGPECFKVCRKAGYTVLVRNEAGELVAG